MKEMDLAQEVRLAREAIAKQGLGDMHLHEAIDILGDEESKLSAQVRSLESELKELTEAVILGPLNGKTAEQEIISLRKQVAELQMHICEMHERD